MAARRRTRSDALEPAILDAAEALLEEVGPEALSIRRIAERACVAPMGLYSRFDGKHGVIDALFKEGFSLLGTTIRATASIADPLDAFRAAGRSYRDLARAHPARYALMFSRAVPGFTPSDAAVEVAQAAFQALVDAAQRCRDADAMRELDAVDVAQDVWSACHGWVSLELSGINFAADLDAGYEQLLDLLFRGLAPDHTRRSEPR